MESAPTPSPSACGCHLSRRGEASSYRRRGPGLCLPALPCFRRTSRRGVRGNMRYFLLRFPGDFGYFWRSKVPHRCRTRRRPALSFVPQAHRPFSPSVTLRVLSPAPRAVYGLPVPPPLCFFAKAAHVKLTCAATSAIISLKEVIPWLSIFTVS